MYSSHYCNADDPEDTTAIACAWLSSGVRVFDVRDPLAPREIAYYNPGGRTDTTRGNTPMFEVLLGSRTKDATPSQVRWRRKDGQTELWMMSSLGGVQIVRFTNGVYPLRAPTRPCISDQGRALRRALGPARLGRTQAAQRQALAAVRRTDRGGFDAWCVTGGGTLRVAYAGGRVALALTTSPRFSVSGVRPGGRPPNRRHAQRVGRWHTRRTGNVRILYRVAGGRVREVGIAARGISLRTLRRRLP
jgi:hypothetical protein